MRLLLFTCAIILTLTSADTYREKNVVGSYEYLSFGTRSEFLHLKPDNTYLLRWSACFTNGVSNGSWVHNGDHLILNSNEQPSNESSEFYKLKSKDLRLHNYTLIKFVKNTYLTSNDTIFYWLHTSDGEIEGEIMTNDSIIINEAKPDSIYFGKVNLRPSPYKYIFDTNYNHYDIKIRHHDSTYLYYTDVVFKINDEKLVKQVRGGEYLFDKMSEETLEFFPEFK